jgi:hypothetical protein
VKTVLRGLVLFLGVIGPCLTWPINAIWDSAVLGTLVVLGSYALAFAAVEVISD